MEAGITEAFSPCCYMQTCFCSSALGPLENFWLSASQWRI